MEKKGEKKLGQLLTLLSLLSLLFFFFTEKLGNNTGKSELLHNITLMKCESEIVNIVAKAILP